VDSDDFIAPRKIEKQVAFLERHKDVDVLGTFVVEVDADGDATGDREGHEAWFNRDIDLNQLESWMLRNYLAHSSVMMRKSLYDRIGPLNHELYIAFDYEYWARCLVKKTVFKVLPQKLTYYRYHGGNVTHRDPKRLFLECAYIVYRVLAPYLIDIGRTDLIIDTILEFPDHSSDVQFTHAIKSDLLTGLMQGYRAISVQQFLKDFQTNKKVKDALALGIVDKFFTTTKEHLESNRKFEQAKAWLEEQRTKWQIEAEHQAKLLKQQSVLISEIEREKSSLEEQRTRWQIESQHEAKLLKEQSERISELERGK